MGKQEDDAVAAAQAALDQANAEAAAAEALAAEKDLAAREAADKAKASKNAKDKADAETAIEEARAAKQDAINKGEAAKEAAQNVAGTQSAPTAEPLTGGKPDVDLSGDAAERKRQSEIRARENEAAAKKEADATRKAHETKAGGFAAVRAAIVKFGGNLPAGHHSGHVAAKEPVPVNVKDGDYRPLGNDWIANVSGGKIVSYTRAVPPAFGGSDVIPIT